MKNLREIILAIENFKNDIANHPIFFRIKDIQYLDSEEALKNISTKISSEGYQPDFPLKYKIPYDSISTRETFSIQIDDLIIKYVIINTLKKEINFYSNQIDPSKFKVYCILDIYNCYSQIKKEIFIETVKSEISNKIDNSYIELLYKCLNLKDNFSEETVGFIIGSKPDEYLVELFLSIIHSKLNIQVSENISRNGDEFLICANSISELRDIVENTISALKEYNLDINKSKNFIDYISENRQITRVLPYEEPWPYSSPSCPPPQYPAILYREVNYTTTYKESTKNIDLNTINSYEKSIEFLKLISPEIEKIEIFTKNYPEYSLLGYWNSSTPTETKKLQEAIKFEKILIPSVLDKLETIIYRFPRSQYFSALAIKNISIYAKYFDYYYNDSCDKNESNAFLLDDYNFSTIDSKNSTFLCEKSNSILLNAIKSTDIFDYQKYLIIRELYFDKKKLSISKENYKIKGSIPFSVLFENIFRKLIEQEDENPYEFELGLPLRTIIKEILNIEY